MNIVIVAMDVGPSNALKLVQEELERQGHYFSIFFGKGKPFLEGTAAMIEQAVRDADKVLIGISSTPKRSEEELMAANVAKQNHIPYAFFCNTFGEYNRPWFKDVMGEASHLFVINEAEVAPAAKLFPKVKVVASGNPSWAEWFQFPLTREEARNRLKIAPDEAVVFVAGTKEPERNFLLYEGVARAVCEVQGRKIRVVLGRHGGEAYPVELYDGLLKRAGCDISFMPADMKSSEAMCGADLVISSFSAIGIEAACRRLPVIDYVSHLDEQWWLELSGSKEWAPVKWEVAELLENPDPMELADRIEKRLDLARPKSELMKERQELVLKPEMFQNAAKTIVSSLTA